MSKQAMNSVTTVQLRQANGGVRDYTASATCRHTVNSSQSPASLHAPPQGLRATTGAWARALGTHGSRDKPGGPSAATRGGHRDPASSSSSIFPGGTKATGWQKEKKFPPAMLKTSCRRRNVGWEGDLYSGGGARLRPSPRPGQVSSFEAMAGPPGHRDSVHRRAKVKQNKKCPANPLHTIRGKAKQYSSTEKYFSIFF